MNSLIINIGLTGLLFFAFGVMLLLGVIKRQRLYYLGSAVFFVLFLAGFTYNLFFIASTASKRINAALQPRTGKVIYTALFGKEHGTCVKVLESQDQIVPRLDVGIFLHFESCPAEMLRIIRVAKLKRREPAIEMETMELTSAPAWFQSGLLGDSVVVWEYQSEQANNWRIMFVNANMSEAFYADIAD